MRRRSLTRRAAWLRAAVVALVLVGWWWGEWPSVHAQSAEPTTLPNEYTVKAVFLYSFGRYVEWPATVFTNASAPFVIGIVGEDAIGGALDEIAAKKTIQGRPIVVRRFTSPEEYQQPCQILFVSQSVPNDQQAVVIKKVGQSPVLVIGEMPGFAERGAIANFIVDGERIRFEINIENARRAQLRMDAKLLSLGAPVGANGAASD